MRFEIAIELTIHASARMSLHAGSYWWLSGSSSSCCWWNIDSDKTGMEAAATRMRRRRQSVSSNQWTGNERRARVLTRIRTAASGEHKPDRRWASQSREKKVVVWETTLRMAANSQMSFTCIQLFFQVPFGGVVRPTIVSTQNNWHSDPQWEYFQFIRLYSNFSGRKDALSTQITRQHENREKSVLSTQMLMIHLHIQLEGVATIY